MQYSYPIDGRSGVGAWCAVMLVESRDVRKAQKQRWMPQGSQRVLQIASSVFVGPGVGLAHGPWTRKHGNRQSKFESATCFHAGVRVCRKHLAAVS